TERGISKICRTGGEMIARTQQRAELRFDFVYRPEEFEGKLRPYIFRSPRAQPGSYSVGGDLPVA
ncbi:MAG: hypothetical protein WBC77_02780, partial [Candidatus Zixiibacteriota bacterium]